MRRAARSSPVGPVSELDALRKNVGEHRIGVESRVLRVRAVVHHLGHHAAGRGHRGEQFRAPRPGRPRRSAARRRRPRPPPPGRPAAHGWSAHRWPRGRPARSGRTRPTSPRPSREDGYAHEFSPFIRPSRRRGVELGVLGAQRLDHGADLGGGGIGPRKSRVTGGPHWASPLTGHRRPARLHRCSRTGRRRRSARTSAGPGRASSRRSGCPGCAGRCPRRGGSRARRGTRRRPRPRRGR